MRLQIDCPRCKGGGTEQGKPCGTCYGKGTNDEDTYICIKCFHPMMFHDTFLGGKILCMQDECYCDEKVSEMARDI